MIKEEDLSGGFRTPVYGKLVGISTCGICKNRVEGTWKCKVYGECLKEIMYKNAAVCEHENIDTSHLSYNKFVEFRENQLKKN